MKITWKNQTKNLFNQNFDYAQNELLSFLEKHKLLIIDSNEYVNEVIHYDSKDLFDQDMIRLSQGQLTTIPKTYVAVGSDKILRIISWEAYQKVHPEHALNDYNKILIHELAHLYHAKVYTDEKMGPIWFFEGFAILAANQYQNNATLSPERVRSVIKEPQRGDYRDYAFIIRHLVEKHSLPDLLKKASGDEQEFLKFLNL